MSITLSTVLGNAILDSIDTAINAGAAAGSLEVATSSAFTTILADFTLNDPAFASADAKSMALDVDPAVSATVLTSGTAANMRFLDSDDTEVLRGTVGTSNADLIFDAIIWTENGTVTITTGALTIA
jgi:hypothetical protein